MRIFLNFRMLALLVAGLLVAGVRVEAQGFGLSVTSSTNLVILNNSLTYTIDVTNQTGVLLTNVFVTNAPSATVVLGSVTASQGTNFTNSASLIFALGSLTNGTSAQMTLTLQPTTTGFLINTIVVGSDTVTNIAFTNVVVQVITAQADLGVAMIGPAQAVITNDLMTYGVTVTNLGPSAAPNVILTNTLPPGVILKGVAPTNQTYSVVTSNLIFNLGTLTNGGYMNLQFTVQPTNAGVLTFSAIRRRGGLA